jgi:heme A synthase
MHRIVAIVSFVVVCVVIWIAASALPSSTQAQSNYNAICATTSGCGNTP